MVYSIVKTKFAHIIKEDFSIGLIHLEYPRCIMWFGSGFEDPVFEWLDEPTIEAANRVILELEMKEVDLGYNGNNSIPLLNYEEYLF